MAGKNVILVTMLFCNVIALVSCLYRLGADWFYYGNIIGVWVLGIYTAEAWIKGRTGL